MVTYEGHRSYSGHEIYSQFDENLAFGIHLHNSFELVYVKEGELSVHLDGKEYTVKNGQAMFILPNSIHSYKTEKYSVSELYIFSNRYVHTFYGQIKNKAPLCPIFNLENPEMLRDLNDKGIDKYLAKSIFYNLIYQFNKNTDYEDKNARLLDNYGKILSFISMHYQENISVKDLAKEMGYDHRYVTSLIKKGLDTTFRALLNEYRIQNAQYLLATESKNIAEIAYECGYDSLCSFNRNFKEITGTTPKLFRQK
jgi:YesN/AraC family two-component response regulator